MMTKSAANAPFMKVFPGRSPDVLNLYNHFAATFRSIANVNFLAAKTMIGVATKRKRICYVTHAGKDFLHAVFPFPREYADNLCFLKIAKVPGQNQYNHHFRMYTVQDLTPEVKQFMELAVTEGK